MVDSADDALVSETTMTPRSASSGEKSSLNVGDSTRSGAETAASRSLGTGIPLGSVLELAWLSVSHGSLPPAEFRDQKTPIDLVLRWSAQVSSRLFQRPPQSSRLSVPATSFKHDVWDLPSSDSVVRVALTPELLQPLGDAQNQSFVLLNVSLAPRRSTGSSWNLGFSLAVDAKMLLQCRSDQVLQVETALCDQDGGSAGVASVLLRCGQPSQMTAPSKSLVRHEPQPVDVRLQLAQLKRLMETKTFATKGVDVVLEVSVIGQEASRAIRSRPMKLLKADADLSMENAVTLRVEDKHTQAIRLAVYRHSVKERAMRVAEALISISSLEGSADKTVVIPMLSSATTDNRGDKTQDRWGELLVTTTVAPCEVKNSSDELLPSAASSVLGESIYAAELGDVEGTLETELMEASLDGQADGINHAKLTLDVKLRVLSSKWAATATTVPSVGAERGFRFKQQWFSTTIQWATKERAIPTLQCGLTLQVSGAATTKETKSFKQSSHRGKKSGSGDDDSAVTTKTAFGSYAVQLPVLFTYSDVWMTMELPINLSSDDDPAKKTASVWLRLRMRLVTNTASGPQRFQALPGMVSGHLTLSSARASGTFLKKHHRPDDTYAIVLGTSAKPTQEKASTVSTAVDATGVSWASCVSYEVLRTEFAPVLIVQVFRILRSSTNAGVDVGNDEAVADGEHGELLGMLSMPLPGDVLHQKHLVSFSLPFATASTSGDRDGASSRKAGTLSFDLQFVDDSLSIASRHTSTVRLILQRVLWTSTPPSLALAITSGRSFSLRGSFSIVGGESLNEVLWSHDTTDLLATSDQGGGYLVDHSIRLSDATIAQLAVSTTATKSMLIVKLTSSERSRDGECAVLGQAVVPIRGGWTAFAELERSKWHKLYEVGRRGSGNPEAIGEIQLSVVNKEEEEATAQGSAEGDHVKRVDEWLYLEVIEAVWKPSPNSSDVSDKRRSMEAFVQLSQAGSTRKPQKTKSQWSTDAGWRWNGDGLLTLPVAVDKGENASSYVLVLVIDRDQRVQVTNQVDIQDYVQRSRHIGAFEDWISSGDNDAHVRLRISSMPPVFGSLKLSIHTIRSFFSSHANDLSLQRFAWRCTFVPTQASAKTEAKERGARSLGFLEGSQLALSLDSSRGEFASQVLPAFKLQLLGYGMGIQELCLGEASSPLPAFLWSLLQSPGTTHKEWITLQSRHDATQRVAVVLVGFELTRGLKPDPAIDAEVFASTEEWREASAAVLTLWKKLFYSIDSDHNGRVDLNEFKEQFVSHAEVFSKTQDGKMLLRVLFPQSQERADLAAIEKLFDEMDINGDKGIEWLEFVDYMQSKLLAIKPQNSTRVSPAVMPAADSRPAELRSPESTNSQDIQAAPARELRRKRREDPHILSDDIPSVPTSGVESSKRLSVRQLSASSTRRSNGATASTNGASPRAESTQLEAKVASLQAMLDMEKQKSAGLQDELRSLRLANHQLQMQRERELLEEKTKAQFLTEAIRSHEQALKDRDAVRAKHHTASIVLQSKVRMRLEQKKFQALRMLRWGAVVRIQCAYRCFTANKILRTLRDIESWKRKCMASATKLQRFVRLHLRRKERLLHREARALSAVLLQKCVRRWLAMRFRKQYLKATVEVQTWTRRWLAVRELERRRDAKQHLKHWIRGCVDRRRWCRVRVCVSRVQRWWRRANELRWEYVTHLEAAMCIQAVWRGHHNRQRLREQLMRRHDTAGAQSKLMAAAMGGEDDEVEGGEKTNAEETVVEVVSEAAAGAEEETVEEAVSGQKADETAIKDQEEVEEEDHHSIDDSFGVVDLGGDESVPPAEPSAGQSGEGEPSTEEETTTTAVSLSTLNVNTHEYSPKEDEIAEREAPEIRDHETVVASEETKLPAAEAPDSAHQVDGTIEAEDAEHSASPSRVVEALSSLIDRVVAGATNRAASEHASVAFESPETASIDAKREEFEPTEPTSEDVGNTLEVERVDKNDDECPLAGGEQPSHLDDKTEKKRQADDDEVERVLCQLVEAVADQTFAVSIPEQNGDAIEQSTGEDMLLEDQNGDSTAAPDDTSPIGDDVVPVSAEAEMKRPDEEGACTVGQSRTISEEGIGEGNTVGGEQHGDGNEAEPLNPKDPVETEGAEVSQNEDLFGASMPATATEDTPHEEPLKADDRAELVDDDPSDDVVKDAELPASQAEDATNEVDTGPLKEQARDEKPLVEDATPTTTKSGELIECDSDEHFAVKEDEAVGSEAVEERVVDEESEDGDHVAVPNDDATPEPESFVATKAFDISDIDDERDRSRELESSHDSDDLQFMADADAVTHVQEAQLPGEESVDDDVDSRQLSERADSEQQLLLDLDQLTQPALASRKSHIETNSGDQVVVADRD